MAHDLLTISDEFVYEYEYENTEKIKKMKKTILDDKDKTWVNYRQKHVSEVGEELKVEISNFFKKKMICL